MNPTEQIELLIKYLNSLDECTERKDRDRIKQEIEKLLLVSA